MSSTTSNSSNIPPKSDEEKQDKKKGSDRRFIIPKIPSYKPKLNHKGLPIRTEISKRKRTVSVNSGSPGRLGAKQKAISVSNGDLSSLNAPDEIDLPSKILPLQINDTDELQKEHDAAHKELMVITVDLDENEDVLVDENKINIDEFWDDPDHLNEDIPPDINSTAIK